MTKDEFLSLLRDGKIPAEDVRTALEQVPKSEFVPFNEQYPIEPSNDWDTDYFREQVSIAERDNFARERCEHLIAYKHNLQDMAVKGFALLKVNTQSTSLQKPDQNTASVDDELETLLQNPEKQLQGYHPSSTMQQYIEMNNVSLVRATLAAELTNNRLDAEDLIKNMLYVYRLFPTAFEPYTASKFHPLFDTNKQVWNPDYFDQQTSYLSRNFALERVNHIINVRTYLRQQGHASFRKLAPPPQRPNTEQSRQLETSEAKAQNNARHSTSRCGLFKVAATLIGGSTLLALIIILLLQEK